MPLIVLKAGGERTVVELKEAAEMQSRFRKALEYGVCHTLDLSGRAWPIEGLQLLRPVLDQVCASVRILKFDDITASLPTADGLASLGFLAKIFGTAPLLTTVSLNDNAVGTRGIDQLRPLLTNPSVTSLSLENIGMAEADCADLRAILACRSLQSLWTGRNQMGAVGASHIGALLSSCSQLELLSYKGARPLKLGTADLCRGLAELSTTCGTAGTRLHTLDLQECCLGDDSTSDPVVDLCSVLENSPRLHTLILRDGELQVSGLTMVLAALRKSGAALTTLDLGANGELSVEGGQLFSDYLFTSPSRATLLNLMVDTNELGDAGIALVAAGSAACCQLQTLNLECNEMECVTALTQNFIPTLRKLILEDNPELPVGAIRRLQQLYPAKNMDLDKKLIPVVAVDDELNEGGDAEEDKDSNIDALIEGIKATNI